MHIDFQCFAITNMTAVTIPVLHMCESLRNRHIGALFLMSVSPAGHIPVIVSLVPSMMEGTWGSVESVKLNQAGRDLRGHQLQPLGLQTRKRTSRERA